MTNYIDRRELPYLSYRATKPSARPADLISHLLTTLDRWHQRSRQRRQLDMLDDRLLRDIGVDRASAREEAAKPFWQQ